MELFVGASFIGAYGYGSMVLPNLADFLLRNYNISSKNLKVQFLKNLFTVLNHVSSLRGFPVEDNFTSSRRIQCLVYIKQKQVFNLSDENLAFLNKKSARFVNPDRI